MDDATLFRDWQNKPCQETLLALLAALGTSVYPLCFRVLRHHQDAEDAAQKVLLEFLGVVRTLPSMDRMRAWIYRASILTVRGRSAAGSSPEPRIPAALIGE